MYVALSNQLHLLLATTLSVIGFRVVCKVLFVGDIDPIVVDAFVVEVFDLFVVELFAVEGFTVVVVEVVVVVVVEVVVVIDRFLQPIHLQHD